MRARVPHAFSATLLLVATLHLAATTTSIAPGTPATITFSPDAPGTASFDAPAASYSRVEISDLTASARIAARTAEGRYLRSATRGTAPEPDVIEIVLASAETVVIEISPGRGSTESGRATVTLVETRPATPDETVSVGADMAQDDGDRLLGVGSAEALREAVNRYETAVDLYAKAGNRRMVGAALDSSAWVHDLLGEKRKAIEIYDQALAIRRETGDKSGEIFTLLGVGLVYNYLGEVDKALETNEYALRLARELGNRKDEANLLHNIGGLYWSTDEMQTALDYYNRSLEIRKTLDDPVGMSGTLNNIGDTYRRLGDYDRAMEYFREALEIRTKLDNKRGMAHSLHTMGLVYSARGDWETARDAFQRALALRRETGDKRGVAFSLGGLGSAYYALGQVDKAIELNNEAIALWEEMGERRSLGESNWKLGLMLIDLGRLDEAREPLEAALEIARTVRDRTSEASARFGLARLERKKGDLDAAMQHIESAIAIVESLRGKIASEELRASYFASVAGFFDFYVSLQMELERARPGSGFAARALETSERARARSLLESLAAASVESHLDSSSELVENETRLRKRIQLLDRQVIKLAAEDAPAAELALAQTRLDGALAEYQTILDAIRAGDPRLSSLMRPETLSFDEIQALVDDETALVELAFGQEESFAWVVTANGLSTARLPMRSSIDATARELYESLAARNATPEGETPARRRERIAAADARRARLARTLSETLLGPIASAFAGKRLVIVADGATQYLPFAALPDPSSETDEPLIVRHEIVMLPSASLLPILRADERRARAPGRPTVSIIADPVFRADDSRVNQQAVKEARPKESEAGEEDPNRLLLRSAAEVGLTTFPRLRFSRREAEAITSFVEPGQALEAVDFEASLEQVDWSSFGSARILHMATHGILNSRSPELSGLVLSLVDEAGRPQAGFLTLGDIYELRLDAELVVLSACQTALGKEIRGEGLIGLTRGFMYAGAPRVISSLWRVDDRATAELMKNLYEDLLSRGRTPSSALREAQLRLRSESRWQEPYYWAAFTLQGDWTR